jgi:hypothetical protein
MFQQMVHDNDDGIQQQMLRLVSGHDDPARAAEDMANQLLCVLPEAWARRFGHGAGESTIRTAPNPR